MCIASEKGDDRLFTWVTWAKWTYPPHPDLRSLTLAPVSLSTRAP